MGLMSNSVDLAAELQKIYDSEINVRIRINWFWDGGIEVHLGDEMNGYAAEETVPSASDIAPWLQEAIAHFYPTSTYAASLSPDVLGRAAARRFLAPRIAARVNLPTLRRAAFGGCRNGGAVCVCVLELRQFGQGGFAEGSIGTKAP
jgi:hypothetical protein